MRQRINAHLQWNNFCHRAWKLGLSLGLGVSLVLAGSIPTPAENITGSSKEEEAGAKTVLSSQSVSSPQQSLEPHLKWQTQAPWPISWIALSGQGEVLIGSDYSKLLQAFQASTGSKLWELTTSAPNWTPPLMRSNRFFIFPFDQKLLAFNTAKGELLWLVSPNRGRSSNAVYSTTARYSTMSPPSQLSPTSYADSIVTISGNARLTVVDNDGQDKYRAFLSRERLQSFIVGATPVVKSEHLYFTTSRGILWQVNLEAPSSFTTVALKPVWPQVSYASEVRTSPLIASNTLLLASMDGTLHAYRIVTDIKKFSSKEKTDYTPRLLWQTRLASRCQYQTNSLDLPINTPCLDPDLATVYAASLRSVNALATADGQPLWRKRLPQGVATAPVLFNDYLILATEDSELILLHKKDGTVAARLPLHGVPSALSNAMQNHVYVGYPDGTLQAIELNKFVLRHVTDSPENQPPGIQEKAGE